MSLKSFTLLDELSLEGILNLCGHLVIASKAQ